MPWEDDVPSWAGPVGGALQQAALGFSQALLDMPKEREEQRKRELDNQRLESQIALDKANAEKALKYGEEGDVIKAGGRIYRRNKLTGLYEFEAGKPLVDAVKPSDPEKARKWSVLKAMEKYYNKPMEEWGPEITLMDPRYFEFMDYYRGVSGIVPTALGPYMRADIYGTPAAPPAAGTAPAPAPTPSPAAAPAPAQPPPAATSKPAQPPAAKGPIVSGPPVSTAPLRTSTPGGTGQPAVVDVQPDPKTVQYYDTRFRAIPQTQADKELAVALKTPGLKPQQIVSMIEGYRQAYGVPPPGVSEQPAGSAAPAAPSPPPPATPAVRPAPAPRGGPRVVNPAIVSDEQLREQERKAEDQRLQREANARDAERLQIAREAEERNRLGTGPNNQQNRIANDLYMTKQVKNPNYADLQPEDRKKVDDIIESKEITDELRKQADELRKQSAEERAEERAKRQEQRELTGPVTPGQAAIANKLFSEGKVRKRYYAELDADEQEMVNKIERAPKLRKEHQEALKLAQPMMDELAMLESTQHLTREILPLLTRRNVGLGGSVQNFSNWAWQWKPGYKEGFLKRAEEQIEAEGLGPKIDEALERAKATAAIEGTDPGIISNLYYSGGRSRLEALSALLIYSHAMAQKRIGAGTARGITTEDMKEARQLFDPSSWWATPDKMVERLVALQGFIQRSRIRKEEEVRQRHIDPATGYLVLKDYTIDQLSGEAEPPKSAPAASDAERLKQGPRRRSEQ